MTNTHMRVELPGLPSPSRWPRLDGAWPYVVAALAVLGATANIFLLDTSAPVASYVLAVIATTWLAGTRGGVAAMALSTVGLVHYFLHPIEPHAHEDAERVAYFLVIAGFIVWVIASERRAAYALRAARDDLRLVIDTMPTMSWSLLPDGRLEFLNRRWLDYCGMSLEQALVDANAVLHPDDAARARQAWADCGARGVDFDQELRLRRADGVYRWFLVRTVPLVGADGKVIRWYGTSTDIEDRKVAEQGLHRLSHRLLEVHEEERRHLSRELHDEFGQLLAAVSLHLEAARASGSEATRAILDDAMGLLVQAGGHMRRLALELRPRMLETDGLDATLRWLAAEHRRRTGIATLVEGEIGEVPIPVATACFRATQQALTNVVQHAAARNVAIRLERDAERVQVAIADDGVGFDVAATLKGAADGGHLGLLGMRERVEILRGRLTIESAPGRGTRVQIAIPLR